MARVKAFRRSVVALIAAITLIVTPLPASAAWSPGLNSAVWSPEDGCQDQNNEALAINGQIDAHNGQPVDQTNAAAVATYNAEADALNAQAEAIFARLDQCLAAMATAEDTDNSTLTIKTVPDTLKAAIDAAKATIPAGWTPPAAPTGSQGWTAKGTAVEPLYEVLRSGNPRIPANSTLRGQARPAVGDADPAYASGVIGFHRGGVNSGVSPDHVISIAELVNTPGFIKLSAQNMYTITRAPLNFQWLSRQANSAKGSRSAGKLLDAEPTWVAEQTALEAELRTKLKELIDLLLTTQPPPA